MTEETQSLRLLNGDGQLADTFKSGLFNDNLQEQRDEILALQAIFNTEDEQRLMILSEVSEDKDGLFSLQITVCPKASDLIQVSLVLPSAQDEDMAAAAAAAAPGEELSPPVLGSDVPLNRSVSGWHWRGSFPVKYLSPLSLHSTLPPSYPSQNPPQFHLSCGWLNNDQLASLSQEMDNMWVEGSHMPILFTWVNWLEDNALRHLEITDQLVLQPSVADIEEEQTDGVPYIENINEVIADLIRYNRLQLDIEFCKNLQECHVCYCEKPGEKFFRLYECKHHFCRDCMADFCLMHVQQGTVEALKCPDRGCNTIIPPYIVQAVMGPEAYQRWEQLLLQKTLDAMSDTVYCPRCNSLVITEAEEELHLARCPQCFFAFCTECEQGWHQGRNCTSDEQVLEDIQKKSTTGMSIEEEKKYQELKRKVEEEVKSKTLLKKNIRNCPNCRIRVEKDGGCNKMTCKCGAFFCWMCGKSVEGYTHFDKSNCVLWPVQNLSPIVEVLRGPPPEAVLIMQARLAVNPELALSRIFCPTCKQMNLKGADHNNHIKCWNCKRSFCFQCKQKITGLVMEHFRGPCVQHSRPIV